MPLTKLDTRWQALLFLPLILMFTCKASAGFAFVARDLKVLPDPATATDQLRIEVSVGQCLLIQDSPSEIDVTRSGQVVNVVIDGHIALDDAACIFPLGRYVYPIGSLTPGLYTVNFQVREFFPPNPVTVEASSTVRISAAPVSSLSRGGLTALTILIFAAAAAAYWGRSRF